MTTLKKVDIKGTQNILRTVQCIDDVQERWSRLEILSNGEVSYLVFVLQNIYTLDRGVGVFVSGGEAEHKR